MEDNLRILLNQIVARFPGVTYSIKNSKTTPSRYVRFYCGDRKKTIRVSDHGSNKRMAETNLTDKGSRKTLERFIVNNIKSLKHSHLTDLLNSVNKKGGEEYGLND